MSRIEEASLPKTASSPSARKRTSQPQVISEPAPKRYRPKTSLMAHGEPWLWLTGGALMLAVMMILVFIGMIVWQGGSNFWPSRLALFQQKGSSAILGEIVGRETIQDENSQLVSRKLLRSGNYDLTGSHYTWLDDKDLAHTEAIYPEWALLVERLSWGRFYGFPLSFKIDGQLVAQTPEEVWQRIESNHSKLRELWSQQKYLEQHEIGKINFELERLRLELRKRQLEAGVDVRWLNVYNEMTRAEQAQDSFSEQEARVELSSIEASGIKPPESYLEALETFAIRSSELEASFEDTMSKIQAIKDQMARYELELKTADAQTQTLALAEVVRIFPANQLSFFEQLGVYLSRWWEFLTDEPREANSEGGVFPAIFGTMAMTLLMSLAVVPFGVLAALYLREYAKAGFLISAIRIAINNLAGVPSIVFGVFGLGFFCYIVGAGIDELFFSEKLPSPTYGTGGLLWASLTLALLTLPVVIVATEEALAAVPSSMRAGSYACGASKWQTIKWIVLPRAMPGIMTGMILAMARGAGEVAPLMLVGAVKLAPELPIDGNFPFVHPERSFMHLGFHIFDLGFQSQNSEAAKPMVFTTTLLLIAMIVFLNISAVLIRSRLRRKFMTSQF